MQADASAGSGTPEMHTELHTIPRVEHAGITATPATVVGSIGVGVSVDIDRRRGVHQCTGARVGDVTGQSRGRGWSQSDGSADADVATRAIPGGSGCQRSRRDVAHPSLTDERSELVVVALAHVTVENERVSIEESATRRGCQHVNLG